MQESDFDRAADAVFLTIPESERKQHPNELVLINPYVDPAQSPQYVFGKTLSELLRNGGIQFGSDVLVALRSLETEDGHIPKARAEAMRLVGSVGRLL